MPKNRTRTVKIAAVAGFFLLGAVLLWVKHERAVHFQRFQGAWEGAMHFHRGQVMCVQRVVLKIFEENNSYRATVDVIDLGLKDLPAGRFDFGSNVVNFKLANGTSYHGRVDANTMELRGRWMWPGGYSQPLALARTNTPDAVPSPLAEAECAPRAGSDLQGQWAGAVTLDKQTSPFRIGLKIAEAVDGTFRAEAKNLDQTNIPWPVTFLTYRQPHVKFELQGIGILFEGDLNENHSRMAGTVIVGKPYAMTFERVAPMGTTNSVAEAGI